MITKRGLTLLAVLCLIWLSSCLADPSPTVVPTVGATERRQPTETIQPTPSPLPRETQSGENARDDQSQLDKEQPTRGNPEDRRRITPDPAANETFPDARAVPLTDLGSDTYKGFEGGLYPGGSNTMPEQHALEGLERARMIRPLNASGQPDPNGKYVFLSIGMSHTVMEFCGTETDNVNCQPYSFVGKSLADPDVEHNQLFLLNGARGSQVARRWVDESARSYDWIKDRLLEPRGYSEDQVQVIWLKVVDFGARNRPALPSDQSDAHVLVQLMGDIVRTLKVRYPNLQQVFLSSRSYAGYATRDLSPEPYAYESGFAVKWLIESQIRQMENGGEVIDPLAGDLNYNTVAPWIAWGPYLWANGTEPRSDGLIWLPEDFNPDDGTHPSEMGREKVAELLLDFFKTSPVTRCWFLANAPDEACDVSGSTAGGIVATATTFPTATANVSSSIDSLAVPLNDLGSGTYLGFEGGLYPEGSNSMPAKHAEEGLERARAIQPLNRDGQAHPDGRYVFLSIGMSNTSMEFCRALGLHHDTDGVTCEPYSFMGLSSSDSSVNHADLFLLNGARGGQVAERWSSPTAEIYDRIRDELLIQHNLSESQVQVIWLKVANGDVGDDPSLPSDQADAYVLLSYLGDVVRALKVRYPNLQQVFLSSRIYAGYATRDLSPEPYAYESGFAVKWLIEAQIEQMEGDGELIDPRAGDLNYDTVAPWVAWGPYTWADGTSPRSDGLVWQQQDFGNDGTHPSVYGREKVAHMLLQFFKNSPLTRCWFLVNGVCG